MHRLLTRHKSTRIVWVAGVSVQTVAEGIVVLHAAPRVGPAQSRTRVDALLRDTRLAGVALSVGDALGPAARHGITLVAEEARTHGHTAVLLALGVGATRRGDARIGGYRIYGWFCRENERERWSVFSPVSG